MAVPMVLRRWGRFNRTPLVPNGIDGPTVTTGRAGKTPPGPLRTPNVDGGPGRPDFRPTGTHP